MKRLLAAVFVGMLALGACGDDGENAADNATEAIDAAKEAAGDAEGREEALESAATAARFAGNECAEVALRIGYAFSFMTPGGQTPADVAKYLEEGAKKAPAEVAGDFKIIGDYVAAVAKAAADVGIDFSNPSWFQDQAKVQAFGEAIEAIDEEPANEASARLSAWSQSECGK